MAFLEEKASGLPKLLSDKEKEFWEQLEKHYSESTKTPLVLCLQKSLNRLTIHDLMYMYMPPDKEDIEFRKCVLERRFLIIKYGQLSTQEITFFRSQLITLGVQKGADVTFNRLKGLDAIHCARYLDEYGFEDWLEAAGKKNNVLTYPVGEQATAIIKAIGIG